MKHLCTFKIQTVGRAGPGCFTEGRGEARAGMWLCLGSLNPHALGTSQNNLTEVPEAAIHKGLECKMWQRTTC